MTVLLTFDAYHAHALTVEADDDGERRVLAGIAVPWNVVAITSAGPVRFDPGSLTADAQPLLRDHDRTRPVGVVADAHDDGDQLHVRARVSRTALGDETLELAGDGALRGFSVGVSPTSYEYEEDATYGSVLRVKAGLWRELSVLPFQAFEAARVTRVAATVPDPQEVPVEATAPTPIPAAVEATAPTAVLLSSRPARRLEAGQVAHIMLLAQRGDRRAAETWQELVAQERDDVQDVLAALTGETTTTSDGIVPPSYSSDILGGLPVATPFVSNLVRRTSLPATGMSIVKPEWTSVPAGGWVAAENTQPPSNTVSIGSRSVSVLTYAHAILASLNLVNRSDFGGYAQAYYQQAAIDYTAKKEVKAVVTAEGAATAVVSTATDPVGFIGDLVAAQVAGQVNANGEFRGLQPEYAAVAADVWSALAETKVMDGPAFSSGAIQWGNLSGSLSGLVVMMVPSLGAGHVIVGARAAVVLHDEAEAQLRATVVNTLSVELGVIANCAVDVEYVDALVKGTLALTAATGRGTKAAK